MMLNQEQIDFIRRYVPEEFFEVDRLIDYLELHEMVGVEVFEYVAKKVFYEKTPGMRDFETVLPVAFKAKNPPRENDFQPETRDVFLRRIPFNFFMMEHPPKIDENGNEVKMWNPLEISQLLYCVGDVPFSEFHIRSEKRLPLEKAYQTLEFLFYNEGFPLDRIFGYLPSFKRFEYEPPYIDWFDYIDMCRKLGWTDYMPEQLYCRYNEAREALGLEPVLFPIDSYAEPEDTENENEMYYRRYADEVEFTGEFPMDEHGDPIMKWIALDVKEAAYCKCEDAGYQTILKIGLTPRTVIKARIPLNLSEAGIVNPKEGTKWIQVYAGPQTMSFNYRVIKEKRKEIGYTQQQVAEAVQANLRTYQKWENGETTPDGYYLLRILNWLDITDLKDVIIYEE